MLCLYLLSIMQHTHRLLLLLLAAGTLLVDGARKQELGYGRQGNFDYFYLVRQWPATFCNDHYCTHRPPKKYAFTVHGLWPQRRDGTWPEYCDSSSELNLDNIEDLLPELEKVWPSWSSDDATFWNHEWTRHGTCAEDVVGNQHAFFSAVLQLHEKLNIQKAFEAHGIVPNNNAKYQAEALRKALDDEYGVMPHITCDANGQLAEVWMCINKKLKPVDCGEGPHPHSKAASSQQTPLEYNCNSVTIPKLSQSITPVERTVSGSVVTTAALQSVVKAKQQTKPAAVADAYQSVAAADKDAPASNSEAAQVEAGMEEQSLQHLPGTSAMLMLVAAVVVAAAAVVTQAVRQVQQTDKARPRSSMIAGDSSVDVHQYRPLSAQDAAV